MKVYIPILHGKWPEDGENVLDVYSTEDLAATVAEEALDDSHYSRFAVYEREFNDD